MKYSWETVSACLKNTKSNLSLSTFKRYYNLSKKLNLIKDYGTHEQFIGWDECIKILELPFRYRGFNRIFKLEDVGAMTFTQANDWVVMNVILQSLLDQKYQIDKFSDLLPVIVDLAKNRARKRNPIKVGKVVRLAKKAKLSTYDYAKSILANYKDYIVTGSQHLSKKFGISQTKCNRLLNKLHDMDIIYRNIQTIEYFKGDMNTITFDVAKALSGGALIIPSHKTKSFIQVLGSRVTLRFGL